MAGALTLAALTACGGSGDDSGQAITGTASLVSEDVAGDWDDCTGTGGYDDFGAGMDVTIRDEDGTIVGSGTTRNLTVDDQTVTTDPEADLSPLESAAMGAEMLPFMEGTACVIWFDVPVEGADFYEVSVGSRGEMTYSRDELEDIEWHVDLSLGD